VFQGRAFTHILLLLLQTKYVVLTRDDINRRQQEVIDAVTSVLGISSEDAGRILRKYKWWVAATARSRSSICCQHQLTDRMFGLLSACRDANRVNEEWFTDMDKVRAAVGMVDEAPEPEGSTEKVQAGTTAAEVAEATETVYQFFLHVRGKQNRTEVLQGLNKQLRGKHGASQQGRGSV
jgi:hypothetical protein